VSELINVFVAIVPIISLMGTFFYFISRKILEIITAEQTQIASIKFQNIRIDELSDCIKRNEIEISSLKKQLINTQRYLEIVTIKSNRPFRIRD
jgi:hypothetical protein